MSRKSFVAKKIQPFENGHFCHILPYFGLVSDNRGFLIDFIMGDLKKYVFRKT